MKKIAIFKIIIFSIITLLLIGVLIIGINGKQMGFSFGFNRSFCYSNSSSYKVAYSTTSIPVNDIDKIDINWMGGKIDIQKSDSDQITFYETYVNEKNTDKDYFLRYLVKDDKLTIQFCDSKWFVKKSIINNKILAINLPAEIYEEIDVSSISADIFYLGDNSNENICLNIETVSGDIYLQDEKFDRADIESVSGEVYLYNIACKQAIDLEVVSGEVLMKDVDLRRLNVDFISSKCEISGIIKVIELDGVSGDVTLSMDEAPLEIGCDIVSGDVKVYLPENDGFTAKLDSVSGKISSNFEATISRKQIVYKNGISRYLFDSVSGDVIIDKLVLD